jgi:hypothetical protein
VFCGVLTPPGVGLRGVLPVSLDAIVPIDVDLTGEAGIVCVISHTRSLQQNLLCPG